MPPLSAYTPFESLLFFQSLATSDARPASFASISTLLCNNPFVRQNVAFSADRLSPEALEDLYSTLLRDGFDRQSLPSGVPNGSSTESSGTSNPKKRKIASPRPEGLSEGATHAVLVPELVSHLYARYKELVTKEIREEERKYTEIRNEIERLRKEEGELAAPSAPQPAKAERVEPIEVDVKQETPRQERLDPMVPAEQQRQVEKPPEVVTTGPIKASQRPVAQQPAAQVPNVQPQRHGTPAKPGQQPQPQVVNGQPGPQAPAPPPLAPRTQQPAPATPSAAPRPPVAHPSQIAPRPNVPAVPPMAAGKAVASQPIPAQPSFQQWQLEPSPQSPYPATTPTTATQAGAATKPPLSLSQLPQYKKGSISSTVPSTPGAQTPVPIGQPHVSRTPSVVIPPYSESRASRPRLSIDTPGSSTPWKRSPRQSIAGSPVSPARPGPGDVSPISDRAPSPEAMDVSPPRERKTRRGQAAMAAEKSGPSIKTEKPSTRSRRAASSASSRSRGRSKTPRAVSVEHEDTERESRASARRKAAAAETEEPSAKRAKRKRDTSEAIEAETEPTPPALPKVDTSKYVMCTRGFHRTAAPIMNDVTTHKLASIFAKPISERDAPGYHDLIYRPQDLKSIKSAVHQGSKAVAAATEAASTPAGDGESPTPAAGTPSKHNVLMLPKSEDLMPPKGIVNSAQLEKELIRMFANAIMYNPPTQRLYPDIPMLRGPRGSPESTQSSNDGDEGGIIQDTLEMFEDVEQAVTHWRAAERTADELANKNVLSLRRGSASDFNTDSADDAKG